MMNLRKHLKQPRVNTNSFGINGLDNHWEICLAGMEIAKICFGGLKGRKDYSLYVPPTRDAPVPTTGNGPQNPSHKRPVLPSLLGTGLFYYRD